MTRHLLLAIMGLILCGSLMASPSAQGQETDVFEVVIPADVLNLPIPDAGRTLGGAILSITAYADGQKCVSVDTSNPEADLVLQLGGIDQPEACSTNGAVVTFVDGFCYQLVTQMELQLGTQMTLDNMAPMPPDTGSEVEGCVQPTPTAIPPDSTPTPQPPPGGISPPNTGDGGLLSP
jgi:hypothetical protein